MRKIIIVLITSVILLGEQMVNSNITHAFDLKVSNRSNIDIYPTITSNKFKERFGVVVIDGTATIGFSPFKLGDKIQISWEEGDSYDLSHVTIDTSAMLKIKRNVVSVHLIFLGNKKWVVKAFDKNNIEIGSFP